LNPKRKRDKKISQPIIGMDRLADTIRGGASKWPSHRRAAAAQEVGDTLVACGINRYFEFAPIVLHVPEESWSIT